MMGAGGGRGGSGAVGSLPNPSELPGQPHWIIQDTQSRVSLMLRCQEGPKQ